MSFQSHDFIGGRLDQWLRLQGIGKRERTRQYHRELVKIFRDQFSRIDCSPKQVRMSEVNEFVENIAHYSAPRFNALVSLLKCIIPDATHIKRRRVRTKTFDVPGQQDFKLLLDELDRAPYTQAGLVVRFLALTGLRINEARQILWSDIKEKGIYVRPEVAKNGKPRFLPLVDGVKPVLERLKSASANANVLPQAHCNRSLATACRTIGIPKLTHHDFRRMFATRVIESGVDLPTAARWLGHSDGGVLLGKTYFHLLDEHSELMASRVKIAA